MTESEFKAFFDKTLAQLRKGVADDDFCTEELLRIQASIQRAIQKIETEFERQAGYSMKEIIH